MRDAKIPQIWEGTNQIHRQLVGRGFLAGVKLNTGEDLQ